VAQLLDYIWAMKRTKNITALETSNRMGD